MPALPDTKSCRDATIKIGDAMRKFDDLVTMYRPAASADRRCAVLYLHGGGLLYGERSDLPGLYIRELLDTGYTLVAADYPLAPECELPLVIDALLELWRHTVAEPVINGEYESYLLFGRSAGAFLSLLLAREIRRRHPQLPQPRAVLSFYGYYDLTEAWVAQPAAAYTALPSVSRKQVDRITAHDGEKHVPTSGAKALRYALYVYARQQPGAWLELMGLDGRDGSHTAEAWSLSSEDLALLPPLFIAASTSDADVPYRVSKLLSREAPRALMKSVYYLPHDFDRDVSNPSGLRIYREAINWIDGL